MVPCRRYAERARVDAGHARRGGPPSRRVRGRDRHAGGRGPQLGRRTIWAARRSACRRLFRQLGRPGAGRGPAAVQRWARSTWRRAGAGLLGALPADVCGLAEAARIARYLAGESAGQCGPCVFGLDAIAGQLERLASGRGPDLVALRRWIGQVGHGRGACKHPDGTVAMVASALRTFGAEIERHASGWCCGVPGRTSALSPPVRRW